MPETPAHPPRPPSRRPRRPPGLVAGADRLLGLRPEEVTAVAWSALCFFFLLAGYYVLRPVREAMGLTGGVKQLPLLFLVTMAVMLVVSPLFSALVSRFRRRVFLPVVYLFFILNLLVFYALFRARAGGPDVGVARAFYVWVSVFNLFVVSVFWSVTVDSFGTAQSKRLFGLIGLGGTAGAIVGAGLTALLAERIGETNLLPVSAVLLLAACVCIMRLGTTGSGFIAHPDEPLRGTVLAGVSHVARSPYLAGICLYLFIYSLSSTFAYFIQAAIVDGAVPDRAGRTVVFARIDVLVNTAAIVIQLFFTGRIMTRFGVGATLAVLPAVTIVGFTALALAPSLAMITAFQVCRRASNYALSRPARETLFTVLSREDKYKAKNLVDTFVHRGGDAVGSIVYQGLTAAAIATVPVVTMIAVPFSAIWLVNGFLLGRGQRRLAGAGRSESAPEKR